MRIRRKVYVLKGANDIHNSRLQLDTHVCLRLGSMSRSLQLLVKNNSSLGVIVRGPLYNKHFQLNPARPLILVALQPIFSYQSRLSASILFRHLFSLWIHWFLVSFMLLNFKFSVYYFAYHRLSFVIFSFGHCVVCPSSIAAFAIVKHLYVHISVYFTDLKML
jgi:hypothetical protein